MVLRFLQRKRNPPDLLKQAVVNPVHGGLRSTLGLFTVLFALPLIWAIVKQSGLLTWSGVHVIDDFDCQPHWQFADDYLRWISFTCGKYG